MTTVHCARALYTALAGVEGIAWADVAVGRATVGHDGRATRARLEDAVSLAGFAIVAAEERRGVLPVL